MRGNNPSAVRLGDDYPVEQVSWNDAKEFSRELTACLPDEAKRKIAFRLPTDAEWSVAVGLPEETGSMPRGKSGKIKDVYPRGNQWPPPSGAGNYSPSLRVDQFDKTSPVGSVQPYQSGLYDLGGSVLEWCKDEWTPDSLYRVLRGGASSTSVPVTLLSSFRENAGLTQAQLARRLTVTAQFVADLEEAAVETNYLFRLERVAVALSERVQIRWLPLRRHLQVA